jgi:hypothetical protein
MSDTLTAKQIAFIDLRVNSKLSAAECYRQAGYTANSDGVAKAGASRLLSSVNVSAALARKHGDIQVRTDVTSDKLISAAWTIYEGACDDRAWSAATQAIVTLGRLTGLLIDQRRVTVEDQRGLREELSAMTLAEVIEIREDLVRARDALPAGPVIEGDVVR